MVISGYANAGAANLQSGSVIVFLGSKSTIQTFALTLQLPYRDGNEWNEAPEDFYTFFEKDNATEGYDATPGDSKPVSSTLEYDFANGSDLYLAWNITVAEGNDAQAAQALGIDDVKITLIAVPTAMKEQEGNGTSVNYAGGLITVSSDKETESTILNTAGQVEMQAGNAREISVSNLADGVHILNVKTSDGNTTVKFLK